MEFNMERWYAAVNQRFSVRRYKGRPEPEEIEALKETAKMLSVRNVRIEIGFSDNVFTSMFLGVGKVRGTDCFAAFIANDAEPYTVGYLGEAFILECTAMGLGTCWLGGTFRRGRAEELFKLSGNEGIVCITPIGKPDEPFTVRPRKSLEKLTGLSQEELIRLPEWQKRAFECARRAPSAVNGQPWEFAARNERIMIKQVGSNFGYAPLDNGIAMLHLELGAAHAGVLGKFDIYPNGATFMPTDYGR